MSNNFAFSCSWEPSDSQQQEHPQLSQTHPPASTHVEKTLRWRLPATRPASPSEPVSAPPHQRPSHASEVNHQQQETQSHMCLGKAFDWNFLKVLDIDHGNIEQNEEVEDPWTVRMHHERRDEIRHAKTIEILHSMEGTVHTLLKEKDEGHQLISGIAHLKHEVALLRLANERLNTLLETNQGEVAQQINLFIAKVNKHTKLIMDKCQTVDEISQQREHERRKCEQKLEMERKKPVLVRIKMKKEKELMEQDKYVDTHTFQTSNTVQGTSEADMNTGESEQEVSHLDRGKNDFKQEEVYCSGSSEGAHTLPMDVGNDEGKDEDKGEDEKRYSQFVDAWLLSNGSATESSDFIC